MSFTTGKEFFLEEFEKVKSIIDVDKELPDQVFRKLYSKFLIIEFDMICTRDFFRSIKAFLKLVGEKEFSLLVIDPQPKNYFHKHISRYPLIAFSIESTEDEFISIIHEDLENSLNGSICDVTDRLVVHSESGSLFIYGERELELGIVVCADDEVEDAFVSSYGEDRIFSVEGAAYTILSLVFRGRKKVPQSLINKLHLNYG